MRYKLQLTGNKEIIITEEEKNMVEQAIADGEMKTVRIQDGLVRLTAIKSITKEGIDPIKSEAEKRLREQELEKFNQECERLASSSIEDRIRTEMNVRIMPPHLRKQFKRHEKEHEFRSKLWNLLEAFFVKNPAMPRCPAKVWFPLLKNYYSNMSQFGKWYEYVARNDGSIIQWAKWNRIKIEYDLQQQLEEIGNALKEKKDKVH